MVVNGYKVFNSDWTCRDKQYSCPGTFEEDVELDVCHHGMHFCKKAVDCFNYYSFSSSNRVAEVVAYGEVREKGKMRLEGREYIMNDGDICHFRFNV